MPHRREVCGGHTRARATRTWDHCPREGPSPPVNSRATGTRTNARTTGRSRFSCVTISANETTVAWARAAGSGRQRCWGEGCATLKRRNRPYPVLLERTLSSGRPSPQNSARRPTARHVRRPLQQGRAPSPSLTCTPGERCSAVAGCTVVCAWDTCLMMVVGVTCRAIRGVPGAWKTRRQHLKEATSDEFPASQHTSRSTLHPERHARVRVHVGSQSA